MKKIAVVVIGALVLSGCAQRVADLTVASTKNYNLNGDKFVKGARVKGEDSKPVILVPLGMPNVKEAADLAIEQNKCAVALADVVVTQYNHSFFVGKVGVIVEGDLILDQTLPGCASSKLFDHLN
ncbi:TPA: hypothetical protein I8Y10_001827 [Kluyvera cryocrescens]|uniref:hypothetical protein n=1 Tax=Kluyvera cryocrescens TaxID=580 RepID=UPI001A355C6F|nr:hypothetical protein [Kluyvera cryocrescens]HAT1570488.1 hypothetical protein [Kluyvera cryocrescens]HDG1675125.1 hypothetical protein [Kluyvera cryocrescens]